MKKTLLLLVLSAFLMMFAGCAKDGREADLSDADNIACSSQWCVITVPYAAFKTEPSSQADVGDHGRRSDIYEITGRKYVTEKKKTVLWYKCEKGWLPEDSVIVCDNQFKALNTAAGMNEQ